MKKSVLYSLHGFIWFCALAVIFFVSLVGNLWVNENTLTSLGFLFGILAWSLALFYFGYALIVPKLYSNRRYVAFFLFIAGTILFFPLIPNFDKVISYLSGKGWMGYTISGYVQVSILSLLILSSGIFLRFFVNGLEARQEQSELEREKLKSRLMVLMNQNNPHFVFNVLNNIDALIETKPAKASEAINRLSNLLRYIYTNSDKDKVSLSSEIECIENYIDLQRLRYGQDINLVFRKEEITGSAKVAPMLFLPFIENAFKHGIIDDQHPLTIKLSSTNRKVIFYCQNKYNNSGVNSNDSGIGTENVIKRLDLMYPAEYMLDINHLKGLYTVSLTLDINED